MKAKIDQKSKFRASEITKDGIFKTFRISNIDFTQNLSEGKVLKFPHCVEFSAISILREINLGRFEMHKN